MIFDFVFKPGDLAVNTFTPNAPKGFLMFSGGRERVHWEQMD